MARHGALVPAIALALAFALRLPLMNAGLFHHDEVQLARAVEGSFAEGRILPAVKGRYGAVVLDLAMYAPYHLATGRSAERVVPFVGILTGALLVAFIVLLGRELTGDPLAGALAGAFAGCSTLFLTSSSTGKENTPQMAFVALALWLMARGAARASTVTRLGAAAVFGFALSIHEGGLLLAPLFAFSAVALELRHGRRWKAIAIDLAALAAALAVPVILSIWREVLRNAFVPGSNSATFLGLLSPALPVALGDMVPAFGPLVLGLAGVGAVAAIARRHEGALVAILPWPLVVVYFGNVSSYTPRYLLYALLPVAILAGSGAALIARRALPRRSAAGAAVLAVVACAPGVARAYPLLAARAERSGPKAMALLVAQRTEPGSIVLCQDDSPSLEYYAPGRILLKQPPGDPFGTAALVHDLKRRSGAGERIYAGWSAFNYDDVGQLASLLENAFTLVPVGEEVNEPFHRPELSSMQFRDVLYRLDPR